MRYTIFYSWQSDLPSKDNRSFIENCIERAVKIIGLDIGLSFAIDRDTKGTVGSPDIAVTIFDKIAKADIFICDISIINKDYNGRKCPNPNVLLELGYAVRTIGWDKIVCFYNMKYGAMSEIPFDLNHHRIFGYNSDRENEKENVAKALAHGLKDIIAKGLLNNPLRNHMKGKIDYCILEVIKQISCIFFRTITMTDALAKVNEVLNLTNDSIMKLLDSNHKVLGYFANNNLEDIKTRCENAFSMITTSNIYQVEWAVIMLKLVDWIRRYQYIISDRAKYRLYRYVLEPAINLDIISAKELNPSNPENSYILIKKVGVDKGKVLYVATMPYIEKSLLLSPWYINEEAKEDFVECVIEIIKIANEWLEETGDEFVLDPDYYKIT